MMKFFNLFKKELRDLLSIQTLAGLFAGVLLFMLLGNFMGGMGDTLKEQQGSAVICDQDQSQTSKLAIKSLEETGLKVYLIEGTQPTDLIKKANKFDKHSCVAVIPKGFGDAIDSGKAPEIQVIANLKSFAIMSNTDSSAQTVAELVKETISTSIIETSGIKGNAEFIKNPVKTRDITVVADKSETISSSVLSGFAMQQSMFIPMIVFILITFASQLNSAAIANEKNDKTLETLLSAPVSRLSVLGAKMCASGLFSLIMAGVYMVGLSSYMGGMMSGMGAPEDVLQGTKEISTALSSLGLNLGAMDFILIGSQLFLTILIALAISLMLGALAKDLKSAQTLTMPLMFVMMIPYFITMFVDINSLPMVAKVLVNLIPFTHTFTASSNLMFGNYTMFFIGLAYQAVALAGVLYLAVKVFSTDRIFTMTLEFKKKKKKISE